MTQATIIKLREGRRRRLPIWSVELCQGERIAYSHDFTRRPEARQYARRLAAEHSAVVVLAGPAKVASLPRRGAA